jgi:hypothetical protein
MGKLTDITSILFKHNLESIEEAAEDLQEYVDRIFFDELDESEEVSPELDQALGMLLTLRMVLDPYVERSIMSLEKKTGTTLTMLERIEYVEHLMKFGIHGLNLTIKKGG